MNSSQSENLASKRIIDLTNDDDDDDNDSSPLILNDTYDRLWLTSESASRASRASVLSKSASMPTLPLRVKRPAQIDTESKKMFTESSRGQQSNITSETALRFKRRRMDESDEIKELRKLSLTRCGLWGELENCYGWYHTATGEPKLVFPGNNLIPPCALVHPNAVDRWVKRRDEPDVRLKQKIVLDESIDYILSANVDLDKTLLDRLIDHGHLVYDNQGVDSKGNKQIWKIVGFQRRDSSNETNNSQQQSSSNLQCEKLSDVDDSLKSSSSGMLVEYDLENGDSGKGGLESESSSDLSSYDSADEVCATSEVTRQPVTVKAKLNFSTVENERTSRRRESQDPAEAKLRKLGFVSDGIWHELESKYGWYLASFNEPKSYCSTDQARKLAYTRAYVHPSAVDRWKQRCAKSSDAEKEAIKLIPYQDCFVNESCAKDVMDYLIRNKHLQFKDDGKQWEIVGFPVVPSHPNSSSIASSSDEATVDTDDDNVEERVEESVGASQKGFDLFLRMMKPYFDQSDPKCIEKLWMKPNEDISRAMRVLWNGFQAEDRKAFEDAVTFGRDPNPKQTSRLVDAYVNLFTRHSGNAVPPQGKSMLKQASDIVKFRQSGLNKGFGCSQMTVSSAASSESSDHSQDEGDRDRAADENKSLSGSVKPTKKQLTSLTYDESDDSEDTQSAELKFPLKSDKINASSSSSRVFQKGTKRERTQVNEINACESHLNTFSSTSSANTTASSASHTSRDSDSPVAHQSPVAHPKAQHQLDRSVSVASTALSTSASSPSLDSSMSQTTSSFAFIRKLPVAASSHTSSGSINKLTSVPSIVTKQPVATNISARPSVVSRTVTNETSLISASIDSVTKDITAVVVATCEEANTKAEPKFSQNSASNYSTSSSVKEKKPVSKEYAQELAAAERDVEMRIEQARLDLKVNPKSYMMNNVFKAICAYGKQMDELQWPALSVKSTANKVALKKYTTAYFAPWALRGGKKPTMDIDSLIEGRDYFYENADVYQYLLKYGHKPVDSKLIEASADRGRHSTSTTTSFATRRCDTVSDLYSSLALEGVLFASSSASTSSSAATEYSDPSSAVYSIFLNRRVRLFQTKSSSSEGGIRYTYHDGTCICYKPPTIVPVNDDEIEDDSVVTEDMYTGAKWGVVLDGKKVAEKLGTQELMLAVEDFNCGYTKPRRIFEPSRPESKSSNKLKSSRSESTDTIVGSDSGVKELLGERIKTLESDLEEYRSKLQFKDEEVSALVTEIKYWSALHNERRHELQECSKEVKKLQRALQSTKGDIDQYKLTVANLKSQFAEQELDFKKKAETERLRQLNDLRLVREQERKRFLHDQAHQNRVNSTATSSPSAVTSRRSVVNQAADVSPRADEQDPVQLWEACRGCIMIAAPVETVDIIKPVNPSNALSSSAEFVLDVESEYPVIVTNNIFSKRNSTEKCKSSLKVLFQREVIENMSRSGGNSSSSADRQPRTRTKWVANDAIDAGGLVTEWMDDYMENMQTFCINVDSLAPIRASSSESLAVNDGDNPLFPLFSSIGNAKHFLPSRFSTTTTVDMGNGVENELLSPISLTTAPKALTKEAVMQQKALVTAYETFGKVLNQMIRQEIPILEAFSSVLLVSYLLEDSLDDIKRRDDISLDDWHQFLKEVDYDMFGYDESPIAQKISLILKTVNAKQRLFDEIVAEYVIKPRREALDCIKRGFNMFNLNHLLRKIPMRRIVKCFYSNAFVHPSQILQVLVFPESELAGVSLTRFQKVIKEAISKMCSQDCSNFLKFATASGSFQAKIKIKVLPEIRYHSTSDDSSAIFLSAKSFTCSNQLIIPYPFSAAAASSSSSTCCWYDADYVLNLLKESFVNGLHSDFHDNFS